jgi:hypothetical protein
MAQVSEPQVAVYAHALFEGASGQGVPSGGAVQSAKTASLAFWAGVRGLPSAQSMRVLVDGRVAPNVRVVRPLGPVRESSARDPVVLTSTFVLEGLPRTQRLTVQVDIDGVLSEPLWTQPVPTEVGQSFRVLLGSCYCSYEDRGFLPGVVEGWLTGANRPHLALLAGDQVYLDLPTFRNFRPERAWLEAEFERAYANNWFGPGRGARDEAKTLRRVLSAAPLVCLPDDHEYWNNYPHAAPFAGGTTFSSKGRSAWEAAASKMLGAFQHAGPGRLPGVRALRVPPLSFVFLDTRSQRDPGLSRMMPSGGLEALKQWREQLKRGDVGVVVTPQSLLRLPPKGPLYLDWELVNYADYQAVWHELVAATERGAFVVLLTGDVHWGRVTSILDTKVDRPTMIEIISSPISLVTTFGWDSLRRAWGGLGGEDWPRWNEAGEPPNYIAQSALGNRLKCYGEWHPQKGDQLCLLDFRRAGVRTELDITYLPVRGDRRGPKKLAPTRTLTL